MSIASAKSGDAYGAGTVELDGDIVLCHVGEALVLDQALGCPALGGQVCAGFDFAFRGCATVSERGLGVLEGGEVGGVLTVGHV